MNPCQSTVVGSDILSCGGLEMKLVDLGIIEVDMLSFTYYNSSTFNCMYHQ